MLVKGLLKLCCLGFQWHWIRRWLGAKLLCWIYDRLREWGKGKGMSDPDRYNGTAPQGAVKPSLRLPGDGESCHRMKDFLDCDNQSLQEKGRQEFNENFGIKWPNDSFGILLKFTSLWHQVAGLTWLTEHDIWLIIEILNISYFHSM